MMKKISICFSIVVCISVHNGYATLTTGPTKKSPKKRLCINSLLPKQTRPEDWPPSPSCSPAPFCSSEETLSQKVTHKKKPFKK